MFECVDIDMDALPGCSGNTNGGVFVMQRLIAMVSPAGLTTIIKN